MSNVSGLLRRSTDRPFAEVVAAAEAAILGSGAQLMAKIDHSDAATKAGMALRPTTLLMFGNPAGGTRLMQLRPDSAIDLPMKLLIVADDDREVRIVAEDPAWIMERHGSSDDLATIVAGMRNVMQQVLDMTAGASPSALSRDPEPG